MLKTKAYVEKFDIMNEDEIQELIAPWLGQDNLVGNIPLPGLVSLSLYESAPEIIDNLKNDMNKINTDIKIDTHQSWLGDLLRLTGALQFAAISVVLIITVTTVTAIAGAVRTRMAIHKEEVELLHLMGARDEYITRQLQRHAFIIALRGSVVGLLLGGLTLLAIGAVSGDTAAALLPSFELNIFHVFTLLLIPAIACLIAIGAARFTVLRVLALMP